MAIGQRVQLLRDIEVPASGDMRPLRKTMGGFVRSRTIHRGEFVSVIRASNQPQDEPNAIRYWVDLPELRNDAIGVPSTMETMCRKIIVLSGHALALPVPVTS